jgi:hypothetical protein
VSQLDPSGIPIIGPGTPYINPAILVAASTGISWSTVPNKGATVAQQLAEQTNICSRATAMVNQYCNQPLRATIDTETWSAPGDFRAQNQPNGVTRLLTSRSPITAVISGQFSAAGAFPRQWTPIPGNQFEPEIDLVGVYGTTAPGASGGGGQAILMAPGWVDWCFGRLGTRVQVTYLNGWPHASLTVAPMAGDTSMSIDDITGWLGAVGTVMGQALEEAVMVTAVTPLVTGAISGPGVVTVSQGLAFDHQVGDIVTSLPGSVVQAAILYSTVQALTRGATATAVQSIGGGVSGSGGLNPASLIAQAETYIHAYKRTL